MNKRRVAVLATLGILAVSSIAASVALAATKAGDSSPPSAAPPAQAFQAESAATSTGDVPVMKGSAQAQDAARAPFVGIAVETLSDDRAQALGLDGGVVVTHVMSGAPADGKLQPRDIITAINGEPVQTASDVVEKVQASTPGEVLTFSVRRGEESVDVEVTVGERPAPIARPPIRPMPNLHDDMMAHLYHVLHNFVRAEVVVETEDGFKTIRAVTGTVQSVDVDEGEFVLEPRDGSDPIEYQVSGDTLVMLKHRGDLSGLNTTDRTLVVEVIDEEGERTVKLVAQGEFLEDPGRHPFPFLHPPIITPPEMNDRAGIRIAPNIIERFRRGSFSDDDMAELNKLLADLPGLFSEERAR